MSEARAVPIVEILFCGGFMKDSFCFSFVIFQIVKYQKFSLRTSDDKRKELTRADQIQAEQGFDHWVTLLVSPYSLKFSWMVHRKISCN